MRRQTARPSRASASPPNTTSGRSPPSWTRQACSPSGTRSTRAPSVLSRPLRPIPLRFGARSSDHQDVDASQGQATGPFMGWPGLRIGSRQHLALELRGVTGRCRRRDAGSRMGCWMQDRTVLGDPRQGGRGSSGRPSSPGPGRGALAKAAGGTGGHERHRSSAGHPAWGRPSQRMQDGGVHHVAASQASRRSEWPSSPLAGFGPAGGQARPAARLCLGAVQGVDRGRRDGQAHPGFKAAHARFGQ